MQEHCRTIRCKLAHLRGRVSGMNRRAIALTAAILFVLSWIFPVGAGLVRNPTSLPKWWGTVDVALAFVVGVGALIIPGLGHGDLDKQRERTTYRIYRSSLH